MNENAKTCAFGRVSLKSILRSKARRVCVLTKVKPVLTILMRNYVRKERELKKALRLEVGVDIDELLCAREVRPAWRFRSRQKAWQNYPPMASLRDFRSMPSVVLTHVKGDM